MTVWSIMMYEFYSCFIRWTYSIIVATHCGCWSVGGAVQVHQYASSVPAWLVLVTPILPGVPRQQCVKTTCKPAAACPSRRLLRPRARTRPPARAVMCNIPHSGVYPTLAKHFTQSSKKMRMKGDE